MTMKICQRTLPFFLLLIAIAAPGNANQPSAAQSGEPAQREHFAIELDRPAPDQHIRAADSRVEVSGRAGTLPFVASDVVLLIDHSTLGAVASGIDVDQDGVVGRTRSSVTEWEPLAPNAPLWTTDSGDTVHEMQLRLARGLLARLEARQNRVGLAAFNFRAWTGGSRLVRLTEKPGIRVPVGEPDAILAALAGFPPPQERRWTDLTRLLERGVELLDEGALANEPSRPRTLLLLSHGKPSAPIGIAWSSRSAIEYAEGLDERGIVLWAIPLRGGDTDFLSKLTRGSGGEVLPLDQLDARFAVPVTSDLRPRELEIENITQHTRASSLQSFPDGRFEAVVLLAPGANTLEIRAVLANGQRATIRRQVHYEASPAEPIP
jgi:hypothetical protein